MSSQEVQKKSRTIKSATLKADIPPTKAEAKKVAETFVPKLASKKDNVPVSESLVEGPIQNKMKKASTKTQTKTGIATPARRKGNEDDIMSDSEISSSAHLDGDQQKMADNLCPVIESTIADHPYRIGDESPISTDAESDRNKIANEVEMESVEDDELPLDELRKPRGKQNSEENVEKSQPLTQAGESTEANVEDSKASLWVLRKKGKKTEDDRLSMIRIPVLRPISVEYINFLKAFTEEVKKMPPQKAKPTSGRKIGKPSAAISKKETTFEKRETSSQEDDDDEVPDAGLRASERLSKMQKMAYYDQ